ncbi:phage antirepressor Ant [Escherichia coli]|uniref:AntA/AntB antirepressor family protein n=4 Tax=Escherichia coli TaxID=562 RepID=A0AAP8VTY5_ECOLX|nr:antA/AntB antirepressor family protein [Escherichia coli]EEY1570610.1 phage antirepressor Ant [Escherichia coli O21]EFB4120714.1 phage antirepressor Ant [Escherichia coli O5]EKM2599147.1 antA/AntB antirepressor family protein [Escherichia coli O157]ELP2896623.1 antA/AntB antirepressor family protein [Escherichia coli O128]HBC2933732.1 antA/AntB antirepressor family protein [Escherichia coli O146]HDQ6517577.1 antA/AntB antirepressor family protein [Escherichia coli O113:H4]HDQ6531058.1 ant
MTSQLIPVFNGTIANETTLLVNARDLHTFLGVGKRFASWITERIAEYGFVENQDYILVSPNREIKGRGGDRRSKDYHLTLDTAKETAMVERNEKGRQIRRYFIECEKKLRNIQPVQTELQFTAEEIILLCYMQLWMEKAQDLSKHLYPIMKELNSSYTNKLYDIAFETIYMVTKNKEALLREAAQLDQSSFVVQRARPMLKSLRARQFEF